MAGPETRADRCGRRRARVLAVVGPTACGKTSLALALAERLECEIISADSMQVYRGLDIGTAKPSTAELARVPHHLIDVAEPDEDFSVARYQALGREAIARVAARGRLPVVVGGTALYVRALLRDYDFAAPGADPELRRVLAREAVDHGVARLRAELERVDARAAARIHPNDLRRTIRALEVWRLTGQPLSATWRSGRLLYHALLVGIDLDREVLYRRIDARVDHMVRRGLVDEVRALVARGFGPWLISGQALGYKEIVEHLAGRATLEDAVALIKQATRNYAKRQLTWFRREPGLVWLRRDVPEAGCGRGTDATVAEIETVGEDRARDQAPVEQLLELVRAQWANG